MEVAGARAERVLAGELVRGGESFLVGRDIAVECVREQLSIILRTSDEPSHV